MSESLLAVLVVLPIVASVFPLVASLRYEKVGWYIATVALLVEFFLVVTVVRSFLLEGTLRHELSGVSFHYGIELVLDGFSLPVVVLVSTVALGVLAYTKSAGPRSNAFYSAYLLLTSGLLGVSVTGDVFNMYVFLEITGLTAYTLVASKGDGKSAYAALKYMLVGTVGASLYLIGVGYAFVATGTLNMVDLSVRLGEVGYGNTLVLTSFGFILAGLGVKTALFPIHTWQPDAYSASPYGVTGYIAALVSTVSAYALGRIVLTVYTADFLTNSPIASSALVYFGAMSVVAGSVLAVTQTDVCRLLAYSSVSQFGLIVAAFGVANPTAIFGGLIHLVGHAVIKGALFLGAGVFAYRLGVERLDGIEGVGTELPYASAGFAVLILALVGVPPAVGFIGKWYIAVGAVQGGEYLFAAVVLGSTLLTLAYGARIVDRIYFGTREGVKEPTATVPDGGDTPTVTRGMVAVVVVAALVAVSLGLVASSVEPLLNLEEVIG